MDTTQMKSQTTSRSFTRALALAFNEWLLMVMLFANSIFTYVITKFADYSDLQSPCLICSRLDHILGKKKDLKTSHWDMFCSKHRSEISSLVYCQSHGKLVDVRGMCEACLLSFDKTNKSNAESYKLLVGKLDDQPSKSPRHCTCCNQLWTPQTDSTGEGLAKPEKLTKIGLVGDLRTGKESTASKKSVRFNDLPHVGYTELKIHSDTEQEDVFSEDEAMEHSAHVLKEKEDLIHFQDALMEVSEISPINDVFGTSEKVLKEEEITSLDHLLLTSQGIEDSSAVMQEKEDLIHLEDISLTFDFKEHLKKALVEETELTGTSTSVATESPEDLLVEETVLKEEEEELVHLQETSLGEDSKESLADALTEETELVCLNDVTTSTSVAAETSEDVLVGEAILKKEEEELLHLQDTSLTPDSTESPADALTEKTELVCLNDVTTSTSSDAAETPEHLSKETELLPLHETSPEEVPESFTTTETHVDTSKEKDTNQADMTSLESEYVVVSPSKSTNSMPEYSNENCVSNNKEETSLTLSEMVSHTEAALDSESSSFNSMSVAAETNLDSGEWTQGGGELLDLADAYKNIIVHNESNREAHIEQWMSKDTSRVSQDLKALLTQISASRISPRISIVDQETKNLDYEDMQLLIQKRMLERNESTLSLEGVSVSEIEGESEVERLKRQVDHDRKFLTGLYKELEEERSASAVATNQAMAMITRLQEEKATFQMEALQNLRMMEEQAEYDLEAIQKLNELLVEREKVIQDLEAEIDYFRGLENKKIQNCLTGFDEERLYITSCLERIENMVQEDVNGEALVDNLVTQESVTELRERVEKLKGCFDLLEHVVNSLGYGSEGIQFVEEIASHLQTLRMKRHKHTES
ncbi:BnaCnng06430D [Brassica napus]|uniref:BnaCnng06430D protein n=1 Tax=Brassica napus TaxID=3708 RepID=A0A078H405_BRANA|nr:BnaCnng06430D [Brassica napus]